jgi:CrcB protein
MKVVLIALAGAAGATARYAVGSWVGVRSFPWATLGINLAGSFLLGFVLHRATLDRWPDAATAAVSVGFLGAFTTFSTFSSETWGLLRTDRAGAALVYGSLSVVGGVAAAAAGYRAA